MFMNKPSPHEIFWDRWQSNIATEHSEANTKTRLS